MIGWPAGQAEVGGGLSRLNLIVVYLTPFAKTNCMCITCVTLPRTEKLTQREIRVTVSNLLLYLGGAPIYLLGYLHLYAYIMYRVYILLTRDYVVRAGPVLSFPLCCALLGCYKCHKNRKNMTLAFMGISTGQPR